MRTYAYLPGRYFDVVTFEVKPSDKIDVTAVYEALAHRRAATRSFVLLHVPDDMADAVDDTLVSIVEEAEKWGIGVITAGAPDDYNTWEVRSEARRHEPDPESLNDFLAAQIGEEAKELLVHWFK